VFIVSNVMILTTAVAGQWLYLYNENKGRTRAPSTPAK
jgi:hypothetical protein